MNSVTVSIFKVEFFNSYYTSYQGNSNISIFKVIGFLYTYLCNWDDNFTQGDTKFSKCLPFVQIDPIIKFAFYMFNGKKEYYHK